MEPITHTQLNPSHPASLPYGYVHNENDNSSTFIELPPNISIRYLKTGEEMEAALEFLLKEAGKESK
jgi:hypothetical protein